MEAPNSSLILVTSAMPLPHHGFVESPQKTPIKTPPKNPKPENIMEEIREKEAEK